MTEQGKGNGKAKHPKLGVARLQLAEFARQHYVATVPEGTTVDALRDEAFWAHVGEKFKPWDRVEARCEDFSWLADCVVRSAGKNYAQLEVLQLHQLGPVSPAATAVAAANADHGYKVMWKGPQNKFCVVRSDKRIMKKDLPSAEAGQSWIKSHLLALGR